MLRGRRTRKRWITWGAPLSVGLAGLVLTILFLGPEEERSSDPTRRGPSRFLSLDEARIEMASGGSRLVVRGRTNLPDGACLTLRVLAGERELVSLPVGVRAGTLSLAAEERGLVLEGRFVVSARFRLEEQAEAVRRELHYQPASLSAARDLALPLQLLAAGEARSELNDLLEAVNRAPRARARLDELDRRARDMAERLWIAEEKAAIAELRLAIEEARRPGELRRAEFDRHLLAAYVLAGR